VIAAVVWASAEADVDARSAFEARAPELHALALKFMASYADAIAVDTAEAPARLTRREIQCLKWAAAGKTGAEMAQIVHISLPTVRFHLANATRKLGVFGLSQAVHRATTLGYIGGESAVGTAKSAAGAVSSVHRED
jgi:DNA-binding CsgD family transcriptional regulator